MALQLCASLQARPQTRLGPVLKRSPRSDLARLPTSWPGTEGCRWAAVAVRAQDSKVVQEYREGEDEVRGAASQTPEAQQQQEQELPSGGALYADENPPPRRDTMSAEMKERLRSEYYSLGGAPDKAATNWALYICLAIAGLAVASALTGAL